MVRADCPRGYRNVNGLCVPLKSRQVRTAQYLSLFSNDGGGGGSNDVYVPNDIPDDPYQEDQKDDDQDAELVDDGGDDDPPPDVEPVVVPDDRPIVVPDANPQVRRKPESGNAASNLIKGVVYSASTPDYDDITPKIINANLNHTTSKDLMLVKLIRIMMIHQRKDYQQRI